MWMIIYHFFVGHEYGEWTIRTENEGYLNEQSWWERKCADCGFVESIPYNVDD